VTRIPRTALPDGYFHVTGRGVARRTLFQDDLDYEFFRAQLLRHAERHGWTIHAYCLMPNHYHVIVEATQAGLSHGMQRLLTRYAKRFNERYDQHGHVVQGRFSSYVIETAEHFDNALAYVEANPMNAGLCGEDDRWPWADMS
jgi:REP element-mobilizing transposase RayT